MSSVSIDIIAVGKLKETYWKDACEEYLKRLSRYAQIRVLEVADMSAKNEKDVLGVLVAEAGEIKRKLSPSSFVIAMDREAKQLSSEQLASQLALLQTQGNSHISFVIGGSWGLNSDLKKHVDLILSFGSITLPHNLARVVLLEQLYRSFRITNNEPYHK